MRCWLIILAVAAAHGKKEQLKTALATRATTIHIRGEPKSGTTWFSALFEALARELCGAADGCEFARIVKEHHMHVKGEVDFSLASARGGVVVSSADKHKIPCGNTTHPNSIVHVKPPCALDENTTGAAVDACVAACRERGRSPGATAHVNRDPRPVVVSGCYHLSRQARLDACVRDMFVATSVLRQ